MRTSLRRASLSLCSVALVTVTPPTKTGGQPRHGRDGPGTADLQFDRFDRGQRLLGRVLVRTAQARVRA